jgi:hypothetical protein
MVTYWQIIGVPWYQFCILTTLQFVYDAACLYSARLNTNREHNKRWDKRKKRNKYRKHYCKRFYVYGKTGVHIRTKSSRAKIE